MNNDHRKIIISRVYREPGSSENEYVPVSPLQRWLFYLALIPILIGLLILGVFFFSIFLALFIILAIGIGARLWWLRRKMQKATKLDEEERNIDIEDAEIVEIKTNKSSERK